MTRETTVDAEERVILVDAADVAVGSAGKREAHESGALHRAFSVFLLNRRGEILLQRRAVEKYHSGGLWSNTCCGHPRPGEETADAARRRLREEMGLDCDLRHLFTFTYRVEMADGLHEHEVDHVFVGLHDGDPLPHPAEVEEWRWVDREELRREMERAPASFTAWFGEALAGLLRHDPPPALPG